jgi:Zn-dependent M28 family amino/carboxypeptidase
VIQKHTRARLTGGAALIGAAALVAGTLAAPATADPVSAERTALKKAQKAQNGSIWDVYEHLIELEEIADANGGNRAAGQPGYRASARYVARKLRRSGYKPEMQAFPFDYFEQTGPSAFELTAPTSQTYVEDTDYALMTYSGPGDVTAPVEEVDLSLEDPASSTSGCEPADFAGFTPGTIALVQRGACAFGQKVANATDAGAVGVIVFNTGTDGNTEAFAGTLGGIVEDSGPSIGTSFAIGEQLAGTDGAVVRLAAQTESEVRTTWNVIAETRQGRRDNVVMAGAHLDGVLDGNGINDNGSGSAALLEAAEALADQKRKPKNRVRFAWWGAEELGLLGSEHYVEDLSTRRPRKWQDIALYLNFDMVGSPNYMLGVYDGNGSLLEEGDENPAPQGSAAIERAFHRFFDRLGTGSVDTEFSGRSDYGPFIALNVPSGGLFTGAEGLKSEEEAAMFGGTAGEPYDSCYHGSCDDLGNVSRAAMKANSAAIWHLVKKYARSTRSVNGKRTGHQPPPATAARATHAKHSHDHGAAAR